MDVMTLTVVSEFAMNAAMPPKYAACGDNVSPPLSWSKVPTGTKSIAVLCDDPDAPRGDWVHWVLFNLPPETTKLEAGVPKQAKLPSGAIQGVNDFPGTGYDGPYPPPGKPHRYFFKVFALDTKLNLTEKARKSDLLKATQGHILAQGQLIGTFQR
jgi:Raf kinase inhibitor-like YbhB/YbcL family protein